MKPIVNEIAIRLRDELTKRMDEFVGLYVFGSQVRGDATDESDVDVVVIFADEQNCESIDFYDILSHIRYDFYEVIDLDILTYTKERLEKNPIFFNEVVSKGVYYGAI